MNFIEFQNTYREFTLFSTNDIEKRFPGFDRKVLVVWQKKGYIQKIRNNWYCFAKQELNERDRFFIANKIYAPSYVSLESALSFYNFIPEGVFQVTSVSTLKTKQFDTPLGVFRYRNFKPELYFGYRLEQQPTQKRLAGWFKIATPEKAIIDFVYLNPQYKDKLDFEGLRINWWEFEEKIDDQVLKNYLSYIDSTALTNRINNLLNLFHAQS